MKLKLWPRTLVVQLITVTAAALVISNFAVAWWFERSNELQNESSLTERTPSSSRYADHRHHAGLVLTMEMDVAGRARR